MSEVRLSGERKPELSVCDLIWRGGAGAAGEDETEHCAEIGKAVGWGEVGDLGLMYNL